MPSRRGGGKAGRRMIRGNARDAKKLRKEKINFEAGQARMTMLLKGMAKLSNGDRLRMIGQFEKALKAKLDEQKPKYVFQCHQCARKLKTLALPYKAKAGYAECNNCNAAGPAQSYVVVGVNDPK